jgi:hypothetical protein
MPDSTQQLISSSSPLRGSSTTNGLPLAYSDTRNLVLTLFVICLRAVGDLTGYEKTARRAVYQFASKVERELSESKFKRCFRLRLRVGDYDANVFTESVQHVKKPLV